MRVASVVGSWCYCGLLVCVCSLKVCCHPASSPCVSCLCVLVDSEQSRVRPCVADSSSSYRAAGGRTMSANKTKKVKMATKSCPECDQQIPVACKSCPCGFVFISRKLLNAKLNERSSPAIADKLDFKRRRTERIRRERIDSSLTNDMENRRRSRANSQSDPIRRGRGRPKTVGLKKHEEEKEKQEKEVDIYASLSDEKAFVFSVALAEINRKILGQRLIL